MRERGIGIVYAVVFVAEFGTSNVVEAQGTSKTISLDNGVARLEFMVEGPSLGGRVAMTRIESGDPITGPSIRFLDSPDAPHWQVELRVHAPVFAPEQVQDLIVSSRHVPFTSDAIEAFAAGEYEGRPAGKRLVLVWGPEVPVGADNSNGNPSLVVPPRVTVCVEWILFDGSDVAEARIDVKLDPSEPTASPFRLAPVHFPMLAVEPLNHAGAGEAPTDRLMHGGLGGFLFGDPIGYIDEWSGQTFTFGAPKLKEIFPTSISLIAVDPAFLSVPVAAYYDDSTSTCLYQANTDEHGFPKMISWRRGTQPRSLLYETLHYPPGDYFNVTRYAAPFRVQLAAMRGRWMEAAVKFRRQFRTYSWYPGTAGVSPRLTSRMKENPLFGVLFAKSNGYVPASQGDVDAMLVDITLMEKWFGKFPFLILNRFYIDPSHEVNPMPPYYVPSTEYELGRKLVATLERRGHATAPHAVSEKLYTCELPSIVLESTGYCDALAGTPLQSELLDDRIVIGLPTASSSSVLHDPCPAGEVFPDVLAGVHVELARRLRNTGGYGVPAPHPVGAVCLAPRPRKHDHVIGFGDWYIDAWLDIMQRVNEDVPALLGNGEPYPAIMETCNLRASSEVPIQNDQSFDQSVHLAHSLNSMNCATWRYYFGAPIRNIPLFGVVADNVRRGTVYFDEARFDSVPGTSYHESQALSLPFTSYSRGNLMDAMEQALDAAASASAGTTAAFHALCRDMKLTCKRVPLQFLEPYPSISSALSCWHMSIRVIGRGGLMTLANAFIADPDTTDPRVFPETKRAAHDLFSFYRNMLGLLTSPSLKLMDYHCGALEVTPTVTVTDPQDPNTVLDSFRIDGNTIQTFLPNLADAMDCVGYPTDDLDYSVYAPLNHVLSGFGYHGNAIFPESPPDELCYIVSRMYRHETSNGLAMILINPWGPLQYTADGTHPMNPFTFDFFHPEDSPDNVYHYDFTFRPDLYDGFEQDFALAKASMDPDGTIRPKDPLGMKTGNLQLTGEIRPFEAVVYYFEPR